MPVAAAHLDKLIEYGRVILCGVAHGLLAMVKALWDRFTAVIRREEVTYGQRMPVSWS